MKQRRQGAAQRRRTAAGRKHRPSRGRTDTRTTREVEESRSRHNRKPYRTPLMKEEARAKAQKVNGTWVSDAPVIRHSQP